MVERTRAESARTHSRIFELQSPSIFPSGVRRGIVDTYLRVKYRAFRQIGDPEMMVERDGRRVFLAHGIFESERTGISHSLAEIALRILARSRVRMLGNPIQEREDPINELSGK